jgi:hypothetical protein
MPIFKSAVAFANRARYLVSAADGTICVTATAAGANAVAKMKLNAQFAIGSDYAVLSPAENSAATKFVLSETTKGAQVFFYNNVSKKAWSYDLAPQNTQTLVKKDYLSFTATAGTNGSTNLTFLSNEFTINNFTFKTVSVNDVAKVVTSRDVAAKYASAIKLGDIINPDQPDPEQPAIEYGYDSVITVQGQMFMSKWQTDLATDISPSNAIYLGSADGILKFLNTSKTNLYLTKDQQDNYHLIAAKDDANDAMSVQPIDVVIEASGKVLSTSPINYAALNYLLNGNFKRIYDDRGQERVLAHTGIAFSGPPSKQNYGQLTSNNLDESAGASRLNLFKATQSGISQEAVQSVDSPLTPEELGWVLSSATSSTDVTISNSYYLGDNVDLNDLTNKGASLYVTDTMLLMVWDNNTKSDPLYLKAVKGSHFTSIDRLTTEKLLSLEKELALDINGDNFSDGTIAYTPITLPSNLKLILTDNGNFFKQVSGTAELPSGRISLADLQTKLQPILPSEVRNYEVSSNRDLNGDGVIGTAAESAILNNENFSIYKTTTGELVYSTVPGIDPGDAILNPIGISLSQSDQKLIESSNLVVATIQDGFLFIGAQSQDALTGLSVLRENKFELKGLTGAQNFNSTGSPVDWQYNNSSASRSDFLKKEDFYNADLNNDGVIGDAIVGQLAANAESTVYQTAVGTIYLSGNNGLTTGDLIDTGKTAFKIYSLEDAPDTIDAAIRKDNSIFVFRSDKNSDGEMIHAKETFSIADKTASSTGKVELSKIDLVLAEITYGIDINGDDQLGANIHQVLFGTSSPTYPTVTLQNAGLYQLKAGPEPDAAPLPALIAATGANFVVGDAQPYSSVYFLKNSQNSASTYWEMPIYGARRTATVVGEGIFENNPANAVDIVIKDTPNPGYSGTTNYYLVSFDATGTTAKPKGTMLSQFALYNEELKIGTDLTGDGVIGDTVSKIASSDAFGLYQLNHSGAIILSSDGTWVDDDSGTADAQLSTDFMTLKNANGSNWLPYGWKATPASGNLFTLSTAPDAAIVKQVAENADGSTDVYVSRTIQGPKGPSNVIYDVKFNSLGVTKNPTGTVVPTSTVYKTELAKDIDINGDGFIGAPFVAVSLTQSGAGIANFVGNRISDQIISRSTKVFKTFASSGDVIGELSSSGDSLILFENKVSLKNPNFLSNGDPAFLVNPMATPGNGYGMLYDFCAFNSKFAKKPYFAFIAQGTPYSNERELLVLGPDNNYGAGNPPLIFKTKVSTNSQIGGIGDFNRDGNADIVVLGSNGIQIFKGDGHGKLKEYQTINSTTLTPMLDSNRAYTTVCDMNGDGAPDIAYLGLSEQGEVFTSFVNKGGKLIQDGCITVDAVIVNRVTQTYTSMTAGDLNGDKMDDIIIVGNGDNSLTVAYGTRQGYLNGNSFISKTILTGVNSPLQAQIADVNLDGLLDIVVLDRNSEGALQVEAFFGKGNNAFAEAQTIITSIDLVRPTSSSAFGVATAGFTSLSVGDFNNDGASDVLLSAHDKNLIFYNCSKSIISGAKVEIASPAQSRSFVTTVDFQNLDNYLSKLDLTKVVNHAGQNKSTDGQVLSAASIPDISLVGIPQEAIVHFGSF